MHHLDDYYEYPKVKKNRKKRRARGALELLSSTQLISLTGKSASRATIGLSPLHIQLRAIRRRYQRDFFQFMTAHGNSSRITRGYITLEARRSGYKSTVFSGLTGLHTALIEIQLSTAGRL
ncbi:hypothetical protein X797_010115 [Metarhizium robertsii]|uniref:Uncharacterized protein n=1 Tax=Metarhizium robertsii TaxID=568076 RepID=A0A0A1UNC4_9HYPO|nr:hypothetical protein X797_010115 [Metarhizium robertsii]